MTNKGKEPAVGPAAGAPVEAGAPATEGVDPAKEAELEKQRKKELEKQEKERIKQEKEREKELEKERKKQEKLEKQRVKDEETARKKVNISTEPPTQHNIDSLLNVMKTYLFKTPQGFLKIIELITGLLIILICSSTYSGLFVFVVIVNFVVTLLWLLEFALDLRSSIPIPDALNSLPLHWESFELLVVGIQTCLNGFGSVSVFLTALSVGCGPGYALSIAAGMMGVYNTLAYAASTYLLYRQYKIYMLSSILKASEMQDSATLTPAYGTQEADALKYSADWDVEKEE